MPRLARLNHGARLAGIRCESYYGLRFSCIQVDSSTQALLPCVLGLTSLGSPAQHLWWPNLTVASTVCARQGQNVPLSYHPVSHTPTHEVASPERTKYDKILNHLRKPNVHFHFISKFRIQKLFCTAACAPAGRRQGGEIR